MTKFTIRILQITFAVLATGSIICAHAEDAADAIDKNADIDMRIEAEVNGFTKVHNPYCRVYFKKLNDHYNVFGVDFYLVDGGKILTNFQSLGDGNLSDVNSSNFHSSYDGKKYRIVRSSQYDDHTETVTYEMDTAPGGIPTGGARYNVTNANSSGVVTDSQEIICLPFTS